ncbi:transposase [Klebsiella pneumoniae]
MKPFFKDLPDADKVEWVCTACGDPSSVPLLQYLPNAKLVIDKFHVVKIASEAPEAERKNYQAQLSKEDRIYVKKSIRWLTLKRPRQPDARRAKGAGGCKAGDPSTCHGL